MTSLDRTTIQHVDLDLRPAAPPYWRAVYFDSDLPGAVFTRPVIGWLIKVETTYDRHTLEPLADQPPLAERERMIIAAAMDPLSGTVEAVTDLGEFWFVAGPDETDPTPAEVLTATAGHAMTAAVGVDELHRGQVRMAYRLAEGYRDRLMYVGRIGWFAWDGTRWTEDGHGAAKRAVLDVLRAGLTESLGDSDLRKDIGRCETAAGIAGVLDVAAALEPFAHTVSSLDADPYLLNCANGTVDLRTLTLRPHNPSDRITKVTRAAYRPDGEPSPMWGRFMETILPDPDVRGFLQRLIGLSLLGKVVEHVLAIETGTGANGKGTSYKAILWALGDYADTVDPDLFMAREGAHPTGEMDLRGLRLVVVSESDADRRLAEATMKRLTGGDLIKARRMRQDFVTFEPSHTPILVTNHLPRVSGDDPAVWRRLRVVPFDVVITDKQQDNGLDDKLRLVADDVLTWAVAGYRDYCHRGLSEPEAVLAATRSYQLDSDTVARFVAEVCLISPHAHAETAELHAEFAAWADSYGIEPMHTKALGQALDRKGYPISKSNGRRVRRGLSILTPTEADTHA